MRKHNLMHKPSMVGLFRLFRFELPFTAGVCVLLGELLALGQFPTARTMMLGFFKRLSEVEDEWCDFLSYERSKPFAFFIRLDGVGSPSPLTCGVAWWRASYHFVRPHESLGQKILGLGVKGCGVQEWRRG